MRITLGKYRPDISDAYIKGYTSRSACVGALSKDFAWTGIDKNVLSESFGKLYDIVNPPKEEEKKSEKKK